MAEELPVPPADDITDQDKLMAALAYPIPLVAIIMLLVEEMKERPFQKYHAVQALAVNVFLWVVIFVLGCVLGVLSALICGISASLLWFVTLYWAYEAYQGKYFEIPVVTDLLKGQAWL
jgi:uncharacterized membrane protein